MLLFEDTITSSEVTYHVPLSQSVIITQYKKSLESSWNDLRSLSQMDRYFASSNIKQQVIVDTTDAPVLYIVGQ